MHFDPEAIKAGLKAKVQPWTPEEPKSSMTWEEIQAEIADIKAEIERLYPEPNGSLETEETPED